MLLVTAIGAAVGQEPPRDDVAAVDSASAPARRGGPPTDTVWTLEVGGQATSFQRLEDRGDDARLGVARASAGTSVSFSPVMPVRLTLELSAERSLYDWRRPEGLGAPEVSIGEEPWDELDAASASLSARVFLGPTWSVFVRGAVNVGVERGADPADAITGGGGLGVGRRFGDTLILGVGLQAIARLEESPLVVPLLFFRWQPIDALVVESAGPGVRAVLSVRDDLDLSLRAGFELRQWRLDDRRASLAAAIVQDTRVVVALGLAWRPTPLVRLSLEAGVYPYTALELRDRRGEQVRRLQGELAGVVGLGVEVSF